MKCWLFERRVSRFAYLSVIALLVAIYNGVPDWIVLVLCGLCFLISQVWGPRR